MKYTLNLISVKETIRKNGKIKRNVQSITVCDSITFDLAKYLAVKAGCKLLFLDKKGEICFQKIAHTAIGYYSVIYTNNAVIALIDPVVINKHGKNIMYPEIKNITLNDSFLDWEKFDNFINNHETKFSDYGIEAYHIWGPSSLIPKGYEHVLSGNIMEGDYYFEKDHWIAVNVSFSGLKTGDAIIKTSCRFRGYSGREENESISYYKRFIIRKKGSNKYKTKNTITIIQ